MFSMINPKNKIHKYLTFFKTHAKSIIDNPDLYTEFPKHYCLSDKTMLQMEYRVQRYLILTNPLSCTCVFHESEWSTDWFKPFCPDTPFSMMYPIYQESKSSMKDTLKERLDSQSKFFDKVSKLNIEHINYDNIIDRYIKFLNLIKSNPKKFFVPPFDVDIIWHAHMLEHNTYKNDTFKIFGRILDHNDRDRNVNYDQEFKTTEELWIKKYSTPLVATILTTGLFIPSIHHHYDVFYKPENNSGCGSICGGGTSGDSCGGGGCYVSSCGGGGTSGDSGGCGSGGCGSGGCGGCGGCGG